jgi:hypothetical protein
MLPRVRTQIAEPEHGSSNEAQRGKIVTREFVVAGGDAPEVLEATVAALDDIAALVGLLVMANAFFAI